jgi:hypothetical protein
MSFSNLLIPNNYQLYCNTITTATDVDVVTRAVHVYNGVTDIFPIIIQWVVRNGICTLWCSTSATQPLSAKYSLFNMGDTVGGYIADLPCPYTNGEIIYFPMVFITQGTHGSPSVGNQITGLMSIDCNTGGEGLGRIQFTLNGTCTTGGVDPNFTYSFVTGSDLFSSNFGILGFSVSYPVENAL